MPQLLRFFKPDSIDNEPQHFFIIDQSIRPPYAQKKIRLDKYRLSSNYHPNVEKFAHFIMLMLGDKYEANELPQRRYYIDKSHQAFVFHFTFDSIYRSTYYSQLRDFCRTSLKHEGFEITTFPTEKSETLQISVTKNLLNKFILETEEKIKNKKISHVMEERPAILKSRRI